MVDKLEEEKRRNLQRNEGGNEDPTAAKSSQEVMFNLRSQGITEDRVLYLNNILENNGYHIDTKLRS